MQHKEVKKIVNGADTAVLLIHGIAGTPNQFQDLLPLIPESMSVHNLLLDGHGESVLDFANTSMKKWEDQVETAVQELLRTHKRLFIVGHSMGTLFAIEQAVKNPQVAGLFLLAVPLKVWLKGRMFVNAYKVYSGRIGSSDVIAQATKNSYGIGEDKNLLHYGLWAPRFLELFAKIRQVRAIVPRLKAPCVAYQSFDDEMVSRDAIRFLRRNPTIAVHELESSGHFYYSEKDLARLLKAFAGFLNR